MGSIPSYRRAQVFSMAYRHCRVSPSSWPPLLEASPLRAGRDSFPSSGSGPYERLFKGDAVSIRKDVGDEPCRGTLDVAERGYLHS